MMLCPRGTVICSMINQREQVLDYIDRFGSISPLEAFKDLGIMRLSARIHELEHDDGVKLRREKVKFKTRLGKTSHYTRFYREVNNEQS